MKKKRTKLNQNPRPYSVPSTIVPDNAKELKGKSLDNLLELLSAEKKKPKR